VVHDTVLQEDVVRSEGDCPGRCCGSQERHWDAEPNSGSHFAYGFFDDRGGEVV
jgi:hypothetical protein